jgi:hypothetical protein
LGTKSQLPRCNHDGTLGSDSAPGGKAILKDGKFLIDRWWDLPTDCDSFDADEDDSVSTTRSQLEDAVRYEVGTKRGIARRWSSVMKRCLALGDWLPERMTGKLSRANENKLASYKAWYDRLEGHRVSTEFDREMGSLARKLFAVRHLRGTSCIHEW